MRTFLLGLGSVSAVLSGLILLLLALERLLDRKFVPQWRYYAWLAIALRLAVPVQVSLPGAPVTVTVSPAAVRLEQPVQAAAGRPDGPIRAAMNFTSPDTWPAPEGAISLEPEEDAQPPALRQVVRLRLSTVLFALWAAGCGLVLTWNMVRYVNYKRNTARWSRCIGAYDGLPVCQCDVVMSPVLTGLFRPAILVPASGAGEYALRHEATHARRHDLWYKLLLMACTALHWFNPLVWVFRRTAERDLEIACDAAVLAGQDEACRRAYGRALLDAVAAQREAAPLTSAFSGGKKSLRRRLVTLMDMTPKGRGRAPLALVCAAALLGAALVSCTPAAGQPPAPAPTPTPAPAPVPVPPGDPASAVAQEVWVWEEGDGVFYGVDLISLGDLLYFTPLTEQDGVLRPTRQTALALAEDLTLELPSGSGTLEDFLRWRGLSSACINCAEITVSQREITRLAWTYREDYEKDTSAVILGIVYGCRPQYDPETREVTYTPLRFSATEGAWVPPPGSTAVRRAYLDEQVKLDASALGLKEEIGTQSPEDFFMAVGLSSWYPWGLQLTLDGDRAIELKWVRASPGEWDAEAERQRTSPTASGTGQTSVPQKEIL